MNDPIAATRAFLVYLQAAGCRFIPSATRAQSIQIQSPSNEGELPTASARQFQLHLPARPLRWDMFSSVQDFSSVSTLEELEHCIHTCLECPLGKTRTKFVFGSGNPHAEIVFIGEAPGQDEDVQGQPFVGRAGQLLTRILASIDLRREDVYICNILKCRPPNNRKPLPTEVEQCMPYLYKQLELINPPFIVALGLTAAEALLKRKLKMAQARGKWYDFYGARMLVTYHPAALLRNPELKRDTWEDVKLLRAAYDRYQECKELPQPIHEHEESS